MCFPDILLLNEGSKGWRQVFHSPVACHQCLEAGLGGPSVSLQSSQQSLSLLHTRTVGMLCFQASWWHTTCLHRGLLSLLKASLCILNSFFVLRDGWPFCCDSCHCNSGTYLKSVPWMGQVQSVQPRAPPLAARSQSICDSNPPVILAPVISGPRLGCPQTP